jgi:hypothetical protein
VPDSTPQQYPGDEPDGHRHAEWDGCDSDRGTVDGVAGVDIPQPRPPLDDRTAIGYPFAESSAGDMPGNGSVEPHWRYNQYGKRGKHRRYNGFVEWISGDEGAQLRVNLSAAIRDLLDWAAQHQNGQHTDRSAESEPDSHDDGGADDTHA